MYHVRAVCWRQLYKTHKTLFIVLCYLTVYILMSHVLTAGVAVKFVSDDFRIGEKYVILFLVAPSVPVLTDEEGAHVFSPRCGRCFITNNKAFMPINEYDAVLILGKRTILTQISSIDHEMYLIETNRRCIQNKLRRCDRESIVTSLIHDEGPYDLCSFCQMLMNRKTIK